MEINVKDIKDIVAYRISNDEKGAYVECLVKYNKKKGFFRKISEEEIWMTIDHDGIPNTTERDDNIFVSNINTSRSDFQYAKTLFENLNEKLGYKGKNYRDFKIFEFENRWSGTVFFLLRNVDGRWRVCFDESLSVKPIKYPIHFLYNIFINQDDLRDDRCYKKEQDAKDAIDNYYKILDEIKIINSVSNLKVSRDKKLKRIV